MYKYISDFLKKFPPQLEVQKMMDAQVMFWMTFCSLSFEVTNNHQQRLLLRGESWKCALESVIHIIDGIDFIFLELQLFSII